MGWRENHKEKTTRSHEVGIIALQREKDRHTGPRQSKDGPCVANGKSNGATGGSEKGTRTFHEPKAKAGRRRASRKGQLAGMDVRMATPSGDKGSH